MQIIRCDKNSSFLVAPISKIDIMEEINKAVLQEMT